MPKQFCNRPQIHSGHNKSTGKGMAVAILSVARSGGFGCDIRSDTIRSAPIPAAAHTATTKPIFRNFIKRMIAFKGPKRPRRISPNQIRAWIDDHRMTA
jgi:hypothetical protein